MIQVRSKSSRFIALLLAQIIPDVRTHVKGVRLKDAWVCKVGKVGKDHWEFHYLDSAGATT